MTLLALLPLFLAMPINIGGLGLPPPKIGLILSIYGLATGLFQAVFFARLVDRFGERRVFINGMRTCLPIFALFPVINMIARHFGLSFVVYCLVGCIVALAAGMDVAYGPLSPCPSSLHLTPLQAQSSCLSRLRHPSRAAGVYMECRKLWFRSLEPSDRRCLLPYFRFRSNIISFRGTWFTWFFSCFLGLLWYLRGSFRKRYGTM
jgi:MFS family permease